METIEFKQHPRTKFSQNNHHLGKNVKLFFAGNPAPGEFIRICQRTITKPLAEGEVVAFEGHNTHQVDVVAMPSNTELADKLANALNIEPITGKYVQIDDVAFKFSHAVESTLRQNETNIGELLAEGKIEEIPLTPVDKLEQAGFYLIITDKGLRFTLKFKPKNEEATPHLEMIIPRALREGTERSNLVPIQVRAQHYLIRVFGDAIALLTTNTTVRTHKQLVELMLKAPECFDVYLLEGSALAIPAQFRVIGSINTLPRYSAQTEMFQWWWDTAKKKFYFKQPKGITGTIPRGAVSINYKNKALHINIADNYYTRSYITMPIPGNPTVTINEMNKREFDLNFIVSPDGVYSIIDSLKEQLINGKYIGISYSAKKK